MVYEEMVPKALNVCPLKQHGNEISAYLPLTLQDTLYEYNTLKQVPIAYWVTKYTTFWPVKPPSISCENYPNTSYTNTILGLS